MRSVFSSGLLDGFIERDFYPFDFYIGVSAGAYNLTTYLAGNAGLSLRVYCDITRNRQFINYPRFLCGGHLLDLDWLSYTITERYKLDTATVFLKEKPFYICATEVNTGQARYIKSTKENLHGAIKASIALPVIYREFPRMSGSAMTDGGVADGIPVAEAIRLGAKHIMVVRSRHANYVKKDTLWHRYIRWKLRHYPALAQTMRERVLRFENTIKLIQNPPENVKIQEICPSEEFKMGRFSRNRDRLIKGYTEGKNRAQEVIRTWQERD